MSVHVRSLDRLRLRHAAVSYARHGWDVTPGAVFTGERYRCDDPGCQTVACHPALEEWERAASHDPDVVAAWWRQTPYAVLLPTGRAFDVLEVPAHLGVLVTRGPARQEIHGPVAVTASGRWMLFVSPGQPLRPELEEHLGVVLHGPGSWVPAPPTPQPHARVRWESSPAEVEWRLPQSYAVQREIVDVITAMTPAPPLRLPYRRTVRPTPRAA
ncbi:MAG TPA: bifunctional DNA primase/polymerase [Micromonosporaceae bacterium]|nr:bifunctional DNA primase/polymerase [Micromonosporaceae bacterium]